MSIIISKNHQRGISQNDWIKSWHTFSFGGYQNNFRNFYQLIAFNENILAPRSGFDLHHHKNIDIFTLILAGQMFHEDTTGIKHFLKKETAQLLRSGNGVKHKEYNFKENAKLHYLQIWLRSNNSFPTHKVSLLKAQANQLETLFQTDDYSIKLVKTTKNYLLSQRTPSWVHLIKGSLVINDMVLNVGDAFGKDDFELSHHEVKANSKILIIELINPLK